jgi:glutathione S-transferase
MTPVLHGFRFSVYVRIARMAFVEKGVEYRLAEVNPFSEAPPEYLAVHPFGRVPALQHESFALYETQAITRYIDEAFSGVPLQPREAKQRARMAQVISIIDSYGYVPMVRQVYAQRVFIPAIGNTPDEAMIQQGLEASHRALAAIEALAPAPLSIIGGEGWSLADIHLAPMIAYFVAAPEGAEALKRYPKLSAWWENGRIRPSLIDTEPGLPQRA